MSQRHPNTIFYSVLHVFILPIADLSGDASFVSFHFDWLEWRSNPVRKKKNNSPCQLYYEKRSCQLTARLNVKGSLLKELVPPSDTTYRHSKWRLGNYLRQYSLQSARVCVCVCVCKIWLRASVCAALSLRHIQLARTLNVTLCRCSNEYNGAVCSAWKNMLLGGESQGITHTLLDLNLPFWLLLLIYCRLL